jgi:hypothetical protein
MVQRWRELLRYAGLFDARLTARVEPHRVGLVSLSLGESWASFEAAAPEVAGAGRQLLEDTPGVPGVAFVGTVGLDGLPRIHPFIPAVADGGLWAFVIVGPKRRDLDRTGKFAINSRLGELDESFFCAGNALRVGGEGVRARIAVAMPYDDIDDQHVLYEFRIAKALWTTWSTPTSPVHRRWTT